MPTAYALAALIVAALIVVLVVWSRTRKSPPEQAPTTKPAASAFVQTSTASPAVDAAQGGFDPDATQMYMRPSSAGTAATQQKRAGTAVSGARLVALSGSQKGQNFSVTASGITVGRSPSCEIVLSDARISGHHAWIGLINGKAILRDRNSSNGTFLNTGTRVTDDTELCAGDTIFFGGHQGDQFRFVVE